MANEITTRYLGVLVYGVIAGVAILKDIANSVEEVGILLAPVALFIVADQIKHRNDV